MRPREPETADVVLVVNTCSIREKAEHRLYSDLGLLRQWKAERAGRLVGVGGCVAQQEGDALLARFPQVDFVFGTHNLRPCPAMVARRRDGPAGCADVSDHDEPRPLRPPRTPPGLRRDRRPAAPGSR